MKEKLEQQGISTKSSDQVILGIMEDPQAALITLVLDEALASGQISLGLKEDLQAALKKKLEEEAASQGVTLGL